ncbi:hypothetical protein GE09DRAFT_462045 [Coniochaeta sp. 2T2.1]|nr:hypothetical protein GE09DRAFT_462045 [Coniochaeta sp. 2T2.1]
MVETPSGDGVCFLGKFGNGLREKTLSQNAGYTTARWLRSCGLAAAARMQTRAYHITRTHCVVLTAVIANICVLAPQKIGYAYEILSKISFSTPAAVRVAKDLSGRGETATCQFFSRDILRKDSDLQKTPSCQLMGLHLQLTALGLAYETDCSESATWPASRPLWGGDSQGLYDQSQGNQYRWWTDTACGVRLLQRPLGNGNTIT